MLTLLRKLLTVSLLAGAISGAILGVSHVTLVSPLILQAESFEVKQPEAPGAAQEWAPKEGAERSAYTILMDVFVGIGFAMLLNAAMLLRGATDAKRGVLWGLAGFAAINLAPAFGLAPELPGAVGANLLGRQVWWLGTTLATAAGLGFIVFGRATWAKALGIGLLVLPHIVEAPSTHVIGSSPIEHLEKPFVVASLGLALIFWLILGAFSGWLQQKMRLDSVVPRRSTLPTGTFS
jgi:cobalt transporter subunit CbtA